MTVGGHSEDERTRDVPRVAADASTTTTRMTTKTRRRGRGAREGYDTRRRTDEVENRGCSLPWVDGWSCGDMTPRLAGSKASGEAPIRIHGFVPPDAARSPLIRPLPPAASSASLYRPFHRMPPRLSAIPSPDPLSYLFLTGSRLYRSRTGHSRPPAPYTFQPNRFRSGEFEARSRDRVTFVPACLLREKFARTGPSIPRCDLETEDRFPWNLNCRKKTGYPEESGWEKLDEPGEGCRGMGSLAGRRRADVRVPGRIAARGWAEWPLDRGRPRDPAVVAHTLACFIYR